MTADRFFIDLTSINETEVKQMLAAQYLMLTAP